MGFYAHPSLISLAAILFRAQLVDQQDRPVAELAHILFGVDSLAEKEQRFRALCQQKYPDLHILEPLHLRPAFP